MIFVLFSLIIWISSTYCIFFD